MKTDMNKVIFTDETRATLDGPDGWGKDWVASGQERTINIIVNSFYIYLIKKIVYVFTLIST